MPTLRRPILAVAILTAAACAAPGPGPDAAVEERIHRVQTGLLTHHTVAGETPRLTIEERLRFYRVPAVSVAVIDGGRVAWARAWGEVEAGSGVPADTTTLFQAASISKPVAAAGALRLVEDGAIDLDGDVNRWLRSWQLPESPFTGEEKVTLRRLLSHSAGTTVHGFPGYAAGRPVPSVVQVLDGEPPANTAAVRVDALPGSGWRYSGGGTSIVQLLMTDVTGRPFAEAMRERVLEPAGMRRSSFAQPLPEDRRQEAATGHRVDGMPIPGGHHTYPEQAAAGLWTTPSDLARFAIEIQRAHAGDTSRILSPAMVREMLTRQAGTYGLGFSLDGEGDALWFEHGGANAGFRAYLAALGEGGQGAVVMTNGDGGLELAMEILRAVSREYGLPGFTPTERQAVEMDPAALTAFAGDYFATGDGAPGAPVLSVRLDGGVLRADMPSLRWSGRTLRPASESTFFFLENRGELAFERDAAGVVSGVTVSGLGAPVRLERR